eukprot:4617659-Prymnesium_polylepis.1
MAMPRSTLHPAPQPQVRGGPRRSKSRHTSAVSSKTLTALRATGWPGGGDERGCPEGQHG